MEINEKTFKKEILEGVDEIFKQRTEVVLIEQRKEFERHIGALKEDFSSQLQGVADSVTGIRESLGNVQEMVAKNTEDIEVMKGDINLMRGDIKELKEDVSVLKEDVSVLKEDMVVVKSDVSTIKHDLKQKVDTKEFEPLKELVSLKMSQKPA
ncbi:MAG: hypothetical protein PHF35_03870 [Candidatus Moranbacteria bacterium]|nr:hypothetical protein [Candidatus Moranbacteria bacterium]